MVNRLVVVSALILTLCGLLAPPPVRAAEAPPTDPREILKRVDAQMHPEAFEQFIRVVNRKPNGRKETVTLYSVQKGPDTAAMLIVAPKAMQGRAVLRKGEQVWQHVPGETEPRQGWLRQSLPGGVFNNADLLTVNFLADYAPTLVGRDGHNVTLELRPLHPSIPYERVMMVVDGRLFVPITLTQYGPRQSLIKTIHFSRVSHYAGTLLRPGEMHANSALNASYASTVSLGWMKPRALPDEVFDPGFLSRLGTLLK